MMSDSLSKHGALLLAALAVACGSESLYDQLDEHTVLSPIPAKGDDATLDIATWNIEWLGHGSKGPDNETLQRGNVVEVIRSTDFDLWGLQEVIYGETLDQILDKLPGYDGFLANDATVEKGSSYYHNSEQKVGIVYKSDVVKPTSARIILGDDNHAFAGRPPLEVQVEVTINGTTETLAVIVIHAKATSSLSSWERRREASAALKGYLDANHADGRAVVIGDFNDDIDTSIRSGHASPYDNFVTDSADYYFSTEALTAAGATSTTGYSDVIDHHLVTIAMAERYVADSAEVHLVDEHILDYDDTASDHYPVLTRYQWGESGKASVIINEVLANEPGSSPAGELIELVNAGTAAVDLSGWALADSTKERHVFADGTVLAPGQAVVVFGAASAIPAGLDNAVAASSGGLSLRNSGERITLSNAEGATIGSLAYTAQLAASDGVAMNRAIDGDGASEFVAHDTLDGLASSPGRRSDGTMW